MKNNRKIRILFLGEAKVGKTSLISTLVSDSFPERVDKVIAPIMIPHDMYSQSMQCAKILIDSSSDPKNESQVNEEIKEADVIILIYDMGRKETADALKTHWLPRISKIKDKAPVIVVGNKLDVLLEDEKDDNQKLRIHEVIKPLIKEFKQVEVGLECSALLSKHLAEVIFCAQRVVFFPLSPLFNTNTRTLKNEFIRALKRIFRLCDRDGDGVLSDKELRDFQMEVFEGELSLKDIRGIKEIIREELQDDSNENHITQDGFILLQKKCIEMMKLETCWAILRKFGYNDQLQVSEEYFQDSFVFDKNHTQSVELSGKALNFIKRLFNQFSKNQPVLKMSQIFEIFDPINSMPWTNIERLVKTETLDEEICVSMDSWISLWHLFTNTDHKKCFKYLKYIGFDGQLDQAFNLTNKKDNLSSIMKTNTREVISIYVIGHEGSGKTQLLEHLIDKRFNTAHTPTPSPRTIISYVVYNNLKKKHLIFTEFPIIEVESVLRSQNNNDMRRCDILCILFEKEEEGVKFLNLYGKWIPEYVPRILVKTKTDKNGNFDPQRLGSSVFLNLDKKDVAQISVKNDDVEDLFDKIFATIDKPVNSLPSSMVLKLKESQNFFQTGLGIGLLSLGFITIVTAVALGIKYKKKIPFLSRFTK